MEYFVILMANYFSSLNLYNVDTGCDVSPPCRYLLWHLHWWRPREAMKWLPTACLSIVCVTVNMQASFSPGKPAFHGITHCAHSCRCVGAAQRIVLCRTRLNGDGTDSIVSVGSCILPPDKINRAKHWDMAGVLLHSNLFSCICFLFYFGIKLFHDMNCDPGPQIQP